MEHAKPDGSLNAGDFNEVFGSKVVYHVNVYLIKILKNQLFSRITKS